MKTLNRKFYLTVLLLCLVALPNIMQAQETTIWSADMLVVDYENGAIGAPLDSLFSNQAGTGDLTAVRLWYFTPTKKLRLAFMTGVMNTEDLTLYAGDLVIAFPEDSSGDASWTWDNVDPPGWTNGETIQARVVRAASSDSSDATDTPEPAAEQQSESICVHVSP